MIPFILLFIGMAHADGLKVGGTYPSYPFGYEVTQKVDATHFAIQGDDESYEMGLVEMRSVTSAKTLKPHARLNICMKYMGAREMELNNGFTQMTHLWKECQ